MAIAVTNDASAFKRSANAPTQTAYSLWGWFNFTTVTPARFWGPLAIYAGTDGTPSAGQYHQISSTASGSASLSLFYRDSGGSDREISLASVSTGTWYFFALSCSGTASGNLNAYLRAATANTFTTAASAHTLIGFTPGRFEWGRDGFTSDFISGSVHALGCTDAALSADELLELSYFHEPQSDGIRSLNVFYPCIADTAANCQVDKSGNARNATATPGSLGDSPPLLWRAPPPTVTLPGTASANLSVDITNGAVTLAGQSFTTSIGVPVSAGALTMAGQAFTANIGTPISAGAAALAGQAFTSTISLPIEGGTFTIAGQAFTAAINVPIASGAVVLAGQDIDAQIAAGGADLSVLITGGELTVAGQDFTADITGLPSPSGVGSTGGGGGRIDYQRIRRNHRRPNKELKSLLDEALPEVYAELTEGPREVAAQARAIVQPFEQRSGINWAAVDADAKAVGRLLALVANQRSKAAAQQARAALQAHDENWFLMH